MRVVPLVLQAVPALSLVGLPVRRALAAFPLRSRLVPLARVAVGIAARSTDFGAMLPLARRAGHALRIAVVVGVEVAAFVVVHPVAAFTSPMARLRVFAVGELAPPVAAASELRVVRLLAGGRLELAAFFLVPPAAAVAPLVVGAAVGVQVLLLYARGLVLQSLPLDGVAAAASRGRQCHRLPLGWVRQQAVVARPVVHHAATLLLGQPLALPLTFLAAGQSLASLFLASRLAVLPLLVALLALPTVHSALEPAGGPAAGISRGFGGRRARPR